VNRQFRCLFLNNSEINWSSSKLIDIFVFYTQNRILLFEFCGIIKHGT
jgi:hypothetical protein